MTQDVTIRRYRPMEKAFAGEDVTMRTDSRRYRPMEKAFAGEDVTMRTDSRRYRPFAEDINPPLLSPLRQIPLPPVQALQRRGPIAERLIQAGKTKLPPIPSRRPSPVPRRPPSPVPPQRPPSPVPPRRPPSPVPPRRPPSPVPPRRPPSPVPPQRPPSPVPPQRPPSPPHRNNWFDNRLAIARQINRTLDLVPTAQWDICVSGNKTNFVANLKNVKLIGQGTFGTVYLASLNNFKIVVKEALLEPDEEKLARQTVGTKKWGEINRISYPHEYRLLALVNDLLYARKCPNYIISYSLALCAGCQLPRQPKSTCYVSIIEPADGDLQKMADKHGMLSDNIVISILLQLLIALHTVQIMYGMYHRDIKTINILVSKIAAGGHFEYVIGGKSYLIENTGWIVYLADFGVANLFSPAFTDSQQYGYRNAEVIRDPKNGQVYFSPIVCKYGTSYDTGVVRLAKSKYLPWNGTENFFTKLDIVPDRTINLMDTRRFPPFEFFNDIQDVIRMFTGGQRTTIRGLHAQVNISATMRDKIRRTCYISSFPYKTHGTVKYILAEEMIAAIYTPMDKPVTILDTFYVS
jgi:serine/threonine protein kinase